MNRRILKDAIRQIKVAREEALEAGEEFETAVGQPRKIEYIQDTLEIKNAGVEKRELYHDGKLLSLPDRPRS